MEISFVLKLVATLLCYFCVADSLNENIISCEYRMMTNFLQQLAANYSEIARLESIGLTEEDRELWTMIVSDNPYHRPLLRPQVKLVGNINGMSGPACYVLLRLVKHLLEQYENEASMERKLMETTEIHIIPNLNPDGYAKAVPGSCSGKEGRENSNNVNLNTNFPDVFVHQENHVLQKETEAIMRYIEQNNFIISISVISGAKVVVYPFDSIPIEIVIGAATGGQPHLTPDKDIFEHLALTYVDRSGGSLGHCKALNKNFPSGIINGADWRPQSGTMMDYNYIHGTMEIMVGVSCCRNENDTGELNNMWWRNREGFLHVINQVHSGIRGQVLDSETYEAIEGARLLRGGEEDHLDENGLPHIPWFSSEYGEFWRPWLPGIYDLKVEKDGYVTKEMEVIVEQHEHTFIRVKLEKQIPTTTAAFDLPVIENDDKNSENVQVTKNAEYHHLSTTMVSIINLEKNESNAGPEEPKLSNSKHYLSLTQLDHSFLNLFRAVHSKSAGESLTQVQKITMVTGLGLLLSRFLLSVA